MPQGQEENDYLQANKKQVLAGMMYAEMAGIWFKYGMTYPVGGSGAIAHHLADFIERQGGHILLNANVDQIIVRLYLRATRNL